MEMLGSNSSAALAVNDAGQAVGYGYTRAGQMHAFIWQNGTMTDLGTPPGFKSARAIRISENGIICGFAYEPVGTPENAAAIRAGFMYRDGNFTDLGSLGGLGTGCSDVPLKNVTFT